MDFKPLITLLAIVNPLACVPFFIHYTQGFSRAQRQRTVLISSFTAFAVIYAEKARDLMQLGTLVGYGVAIGLATALCFSMASPIARVLGQTGINVMTRLMGLILAALAVEVMADGLHKLFPALGGH
ncbi:MAG: MarC family protein [Limnohabitans sp.]